MYNEIMKILVLFKKIIYLFFIKFINMSKKICLIFSKNIHKFFSLLINIQIHKFKKKYLYNNRNLEKTTTNKNLIITNIQEALGDQIIALDLISRIFKNVKSKKSFDIIVSKKFKNFINYNLNLWDLNFIYTNYSLGTHIDIHEGKVKYKNIVKIAKELKMLEYDNVFILTRLVPIDCAILLSSIKCNKIYKFYDEHNTSKNNAVFNELPFKKLSHDIYERLKYKIEIKNINPKQHFLFNSINVFNSIWKNEIINYKKPYELINIKINNKNNKNQIKLFFCLNRKSPKIMNFKIFEKVFELLSKKYNILFLIIANKQSYKIKKINAQLNDKILNFKIYNKLEIENLFNVMNESDIVLCHDSWDYHMANMLKKKKILILNKNHWVVNISFDYWLNYGSKENILIFDKKYFNNNFISCDEEIVIKIFNQIKKILNLPNNK